MIDIATNRPINWQMKNLTYRQTGRSSNQLTERSTDRLNDCQTVRSIKLSM
jgi:hypothetical protein